MRAIALTLVLLVSAPAAGQQSQYFYPVERAALESHVDLQFEYAQPASAPTVHRTVVSVEGQVALADRLELALNVPFLYYSFTTSEDPAEVVLDPAQVGDFIFGLKLRTTRGERLCTAAFLNTRLPVHSGLGPRNYATFQTGGAAAFALPRATLGGTVEFLWFLRTEIEGRSTTGHDVAYVGLSLYATYHLFGPLHARAALQFYNSIHPGGSIHVVGLTPGLSVHPHPHLSIELSSRIAPTDDSRDLFQGRASVLFATSWRF